MKEEEYNNLLSELAKDETSLERKTEIADLLKNDRKGSSDKYAELVSNAAKLQEDYKELQAKKVDEFFHKGTTPDVVPDTQPITNEKVDFEALAKDLLKGV